jgi:hypothetical protein
MGRTVKYSEVVMPLKNGSSKRVIQENTQELIRAGYSPKQASAIAHAKAGKSHKTAGTKHSRKR